MSTDKENTKNGAMEVEETSNDDTSVPQGSDDLKVSDELIGKPKEKDIKKKPKGKESKKETKDSDSIVKEGKIGKSIMEEKSNSEEDDENDNEENDENDKDDGKVPLLDQPLELSGTRERKKVQRFSEEYKTEQKDASPVEIPEGRGTQLGIIPRIENNIQRSKLDALKPLHKVLFSRVGKATSMKKNIRKFNGFDFDESSEHYAKKKQAMSKFELRVLREICSILDLKRNWKRDEAIEIILKFLMNPEDSGKPVSKARPKRAARTNNRSYSESDEEEERKSSRRGKRKRANLKDISSEDEQDLEEEEERKHDVKENDKDGVKGQRKRERKENDSGKETKENDSDDNEDDVKEDLDGEDDDGSSDDSEEQKSKSKTGSRGNKNNKKQPVKKTNSKKAASKKTEKKVTSKKRAKSDDESSEDEPLSKKTNAPPTDEEIKSYVKEILEGANLEETTMKIVCKQVYAHYPDFDLAHKKDFIKTTVKSLIST